MQNAFMLRKPGISVFAFFLALLVCAAPVGRISVEVSSGKVLLGALEELVFSTIQTRKGLEFSPARLSDDIAALYRTGSFSDIQTSSTSASDGSVDLLFVVTPKKTISEILLEGNSHFTDKKLLRLVKHPVDIPLDDAKVAADRSAIFEKYRGAGYYGSSVTYRLQDNVEGDSAKLIYVISERPRAKLQKVQFEGNTVFSEAELRDELMTKRQWWRYIFRFGNYFNEQLLQYDQDKLRELYATKGYLAFAVEDVELRYNEKENWVSPVFKLSEGKPYSIGKLTILGQKLFSAEELLAKTSSKSGETYSSTRAAKDLADMRREYEQLGYIDLRFVSNELLDRENLIVDIEYRVEEGLPSRVRDIHIAGNDITQDKVIRRELAIQPGDLSDAGKISVSKQRLQNLDYFESVEIFHVPTTAPDLKDLRIDLKEKRTGSVSLGAGFSSEDSVMGFLEFSETNFDLQRLFNWPPKGAGQRFRTYVGVGSEVHNISISLIEPALFDRDLELSSDFFVSTRYEDDYDERHIGGGLMLSWPLAFAVPGTRHIEYWRMGLGLRIEQVRISNVDDAPFDDYYDYRKDAVNYNINDDKGSHFANRFILRMSRDSRDRFRFPTRGSRISLESELITAALGSYSNYARFHAGVDKYFPVVSDLTLKLGLDGWAATHISGDDIRIFDRYFGGGYGTIRGFKRRDVSPRNYNDNPVGGQTMLMGTAEIFKPVKNFMYVSVFTDIGNTWWDSFDVDPGELNMSVGVGIQFIALPIRLDYGYPIKTHGDYLDGKGGRFHFNIGYSF